MNLISDYYGEPELEIAIQKAIALENSDLSTRANNPEGRKPTVTEIFDRTRQILEVPSSSVTREERRTVYQIIRQFIEN